MTYDELIEVVRKRGKKLLRGTSWESGEVFDAINSASIEFMAESKDQEATASLAIVAGTRDYTISSSIATLCDDINLMVIDNGTIEGVTLRKLQDEIHSDTVKESDASAGTPEYFRVWNGVLRLYPTPNEDITATVYYTTKIAQAFYTTAIGATTIPFQDVYVTPIVYEALAILAEGEGDLKSAEYFRITGLAKFENALASKVDYAHDEEVKYQDPIGIN